MSGIAAAITGGIALVGAAAKGIKASRASKGASTAMKGAQGAKQGRGVLSKLKRKAGGIASTGTGLFQTIQGNRLRKRAEAAMPASEDPEMRSAQLQAQRNARAFRTGTRSNATRNAAARQLSSGQKNILKFGGGGRKGLLQMQQVYNQGLEQIGQSDLQGEGFYQKESNRLLGEISQRSLDVQMQKHDELSARAATIGKAGRQNLGAGLSKTLGVGSMVGGGSDAQTPGRKGLQSAFSGGNKFYKPNSFDKRNKPSLNLDQSNLPNLNRDYSTPHGQAPKLDAPQSLTSILNR